MALRFLLLMEQKVSGDEWKGEQGADHEGLVLSSPEVLTLFLRNGGPQKLCLISAGYMLMLGNSSTRSTWRH